MKKQIIERIARELLNEARRFRAIVRTAQPNIRTEAKANDAELAFEVDFKVRPGFSILPTDADILDEVGSAIKENSSVGDTSKYADGNYYYIISPDKTDKKRVYLYNVYIFKKNRVWQNYPDFIDRSSNITQTTDEPTTNANEPIVGKKNKPKNIKSIKVTAAEGSVVRIGKSILLDSEKWLKSSQNNIKTYKPIQKSFAFINKVVNNQVDIVPVDDTIKSEPNTTTEIPDVTTPISISDPKVIDVVKTVTATNIPATTDTPSNKAKISPSVPAKTSNISLGKQITMKSASPMFVYKDGKFTSIDKQTQNDQQGILVKLDDTGNYALIKPKQLPINQLPKGTEITFKSPGKVIVTYNNDQSGTTSVKAPSVKMKYKFISSLPNGLTKLQSVKSGKEFWVSTSELSSPASAPVWIRKKDIK